MKNGKGYPRPVMPLNGKNTPMPWLAADGPETGEWAKINAMRAFESEAYQSCIVCGLDLSPDFVYMVAEGKISDMVGSIFLDELPTPTWVHPKCGVIAATFCPHLKSALHPAATQTGHLLTHEELKDLANKSVKPGKKEEAHV